MMLITTLVVWFLVCCRLEVSGLQAEARALLQPPHYTTPTLSANTDEYLTVSKLRMSL